MLLRSQKIQLWLRQTRMRRIIWILKSTKYSPPKEWRTYFFHIEPPAEEVQAARQVYSHVADHMIYHVIRLYVRNTSRVIRFCDSYLLP